MSQAQERQYKVKGGEQSPFNLSKTSTANPHGPSASHWGLQHLNWLHIHLALGRSCDELFSAESELPQSGKIATYLERLLGADRKWICETEHPSSTSIYGLFRSLVNERRLDDDWWTSTHASSHPDSASSSDSKSPLQNRQGILSGQERETTPTSPHAGPKSQPSTPGLISRKRSHGSTPSPQRQPDQMFTSYQQGERTPLSRQQSEVLSPPSPHTPTPHVTPLFGEHGALKYGPDLRDAAKDQQLRRIVEEEEDEEEEAQERLLQAEDVVQVEEEEDAKAPPDGPSQAASNKKSEKQVENIGWIFLGLVRDALTHTGQGDVDKKMRDAQNLVLQVEPSEAGKIQIDGVPIAAEPDVSLFCAFGEAGRQKTISVVVEFKKRKHMRAPSRILGQECAEMLAAVSIEKGFLKKKAVKKKRSIEGGIIYTAYLISWHGLMAYVSRLDVSHNYLEQLKQDSSRLQDLEPPRIRRSRLLNLTKPRDRVDLAIIAARVAIEQLSQYQRNRDTGLITRLLA